MSTLVSRRWEADFTSGLPRRDRAGCEYQAYVPDPLASRPLRLDGTVAADVADAEAAIARFDTQAVALADTEALARLLLRAESVASSKIEGLEVGGRRLLRAEVAATLGEPASDVTATEVLANVQAMTWALGSVNEGDPITADHFLEAHRLLLAGTQQREIAGRIRREQNWIGGSSYNPCSAAFVPPPPELVPRLVRDLCRFCNRDDLPAIGQAAMAHAQFETIHPFADGNGRLGRALIHMVLRRRGLARRVLPPVSLVLATWSRDYIAGLTATRYVGKPDGREAIDGANRWISFFAAAARRAVGDAETFEQHVSHLAAAWRERLGRVRAGSAADLLVRALPGTPIVTVSSAADVIGRTFQATNEAIDRLVEAGVLRQVNVGRRNRAFEAPDLIATFTDLERRLAARGGSPASHRDERGARPARRDDGKYREYLTEEQRRRAGSLARRMQRDFHHGLLASPAGNTRAARPTRRVPRGPKGR